MFMKMFLEMFYNVLEVNKDSNLHTACGTYNTCKLSKRGGTYAEISLASYVTQ
jgi:hypothetical protein